MKTSAKILKYALGVFFLALTLCQAFGLEFSGSFAEFLGIGATGITMAGLFTAADITWNGKEAMSIADAILVTAYQNPDLKGTNEVVEGIVAKQQIVFLGILEKITKKKTTCGGSPGSAGVNSTEKFWDPQPVEFWNEECVSVINESFFIWASKKGLDKYDLSGTDYAEFVQERLASAMKEDLLRIVWFNDTDAALTTDSPAGIFLAGTDLTDYNIIDGLWKQIFTAVTADSTKKVAIAPNGGSATFAGQAFDATDTTNRIAHNTLQSMIDNADDRLKEAQNKRLYVTGSLFDQYKKELKNYTSIEAAYRLTQDGAKVLMFDGIDVIPMRFWDRMIKADQQNGVKYYRPHRALLTVPENIPVGVDSFSATGEVRSFYLEKEQTTNFRGAYKVDTKLLQDYMFMAAYE